MRINKYLIRSLFFIVIFITFFNVVAQEIDNIEFHATFGLGEYGFDSGYIGLNEAYARMQVRAYGMLGLNLADVSMNGTVWIENSLIGVTGTSNGGEFSFNIGLEYGAFAYFGIPILGLNHEVDLLSLIGASSLDLRLNDTEIFTPFLLDGSVTISDNLPAETVFDIPLSDILFPGNPFAEAGVTLAADMGLQETLSGERIYFSNPDNSIYSEGATLSFSGNSTLLSYYEDAEAEIIVGFWPGLYAEAFGYRLDFNPTRIPFTIYSSDLPLSFNNCQVSFTSSDILITDLSLSPPTVSPYETFLVSGNAEYNLGNPIMEGTAIISIQGGNEYTAPVTNGSFSRYIQAPGNSNTYNITKTVSVTVQDGITNSGTDYRTLTIYGTGSTSDYNLDVFLVYNYWNGSDGYLCQWCWEDKEVYRTTDDYIGILPYFTDVYSFNQSLESRIYQSDGTQYGNSGYSTLEAPPPGQYWIWYVPSWNYWYINGSSMAYNPGQYRAEFYVDNNRKWQQYFTVGWNFTEHHMCKNVQASEPWGYQNPTNIFSTSDIKAVTWTNFDNVAQAADIKCEFYDPNGNLYGTVDRNTSPGEYYIEDPADYGYVSWDYFRAWAWIWISGYPAENMCGDWIAKFYVKNPASGNWDHYYDDYFCIEENSEPQITVTASPISPIETQNVNVEITASDNNDIDKIVLHWNNGNDHSQTWDYINNSSYFVSHSIGTFSADQIVTYWAELWDESNNHGESQHHVSTIGYETVSVPDRPTGTAFTEVNQSENYTSGGSITNLTHIVEYQYDWDDGQQSSWGSASQEHSWSSEGIFYVKVRARCQTHTNRISDWSTPIMISIDSSDPVIEITTNDGNDFTTDQSQITIEGTVNDPDPSSGLASLTINSGDTNNGSLLSWSFTVDIKEGPNNFTITATDNSGNSGTGSITIIGGNKPTVVTQQATEITSSSAQLNGEINPNGASTSYYFEYGLTDQYGNQTPSRDAGSGTNIISVQESLNNLLSDTTYHFRLVGVNDFGTSEGEDIEFSTLSPFFSVSGNVNYCETENSIQDVDLELTGDTELTLLTNEQGFYIFEDVLGNVIVTPSKEGTYLDCINGFDLLRLKNYLLEIVELSNCGLNAADANGDGSVSGFDLLRIKNCLLEISCDSPTGKFEFNPESMAYNPITMDMENQNYSAYIYGDVNLSCGSSSSSLAKSTENPNATVYFGQYYFTEDGDVLIPIKTDSDLELGMLQWNISYNQDKFEFKSIKSAFLGEGDYHLIDNKLKIVWIYNGEEMEISADQSICNIIFKPIGGFSSGEFTFEESNFLSDRLGGPYLCKYGSTKVDLSLLSTMKDGTLPTETTLLPNFPNPFNPRTTIGYYLHEESNVELTIYNLRGEIVQVYQYQNQSPGIYQMEWDVRNKQNSSVPSGIYFYRLLYNAESQMKKMLLLK
ncbi:MAG: T9SS type A sorting domain-containing protein [Candidatus Marinimicrobia bacterium]|nr:T9SS type A sorting domain-containing protein [Candidatus Neomarinimicrobiota bacterium]